jgi:hypothetical protein
MSIKATAVVKKETKVGPKKPEDKVHYASLCVLNEDGKEYGLPRYLSEYREVAVLLKREAGVTPNNYTSVMPRMSGAKKSVLPRDGFVSEEASST